MTMYDVLRAFYVLVHKLRDPQYPMYVGSRLILIQYKLQYACVEYITYLEKQKFRISQSRLATPEDNAYIESFFRTMKKEEVYFKNYRTMDQVIKNLPKFIDEVYNAKRLHSSLGYKTPSEFEDEVLKMDPAKRPVQKLWGWTV